MSICSFISDEGGENSQSYMEFSVDTSNILHTDNISSFSSPLACLNLKKLQTLLFQTNYYLKKLEEKMNETQRTFDIEVPLRQLRSHQTVLSLKINSETVDDAFMNFVTEKHSRIMDEIKKVLAEKPEITSVSKVTQVSVFENTEIISNQNTPAFSSGKSFIFRDCDNIDKQLSVKIEEIFAKFVSVDSVEESLETLNQNFFRLQFPKISDVIKKFLVSVQNFRQYRKKNRFDSVINKINENSENLNENVAKEVKKTLALQELHLNLSNLKKRNQANSESFTQTDDSCSSTEQSTRINSLELQLKNLQDILSAIKKEKETIEKYQEVLVNKISKTKNPEKTIFFKERYEKTTELLLKTQESLNKLTTQNNLIQKTSEKKLNCKL